MVKHEVEKVVKKYFEKKTIENPPVLLFFDTTMNIIEKGDLNDYIK